MKAVIVDDEKKARELLRLMLEENCPNVKVAGAASNVQDAYHLIKTLLPDIVFLDIEMTGGGGFDLLKKFQTINFAIIFVTAYDKYAIRAIKFSALDYLLKPVDEKELVEALKKVEKNRQRNNSPKVKNFINNYSNPDTNTHTIALQSQNKLDFILINDIVRCEADGKYTYIFLKNGKKFLSSKNLKEFESALTEYNFFRIHHSHLVNLIYITTYHSGRGGTIVMNDNTTLDVSQRRKDEFLKVFSKKI